ncbi:hypothetical protein QR680_014157 [Steinernema hermaphroditum]|uniref:F-box domain-containing protein n=1 Tax=Steinernema hermaphroditum TaxID=289476 RepID=A0AA39I998_9BILA|nr:hypothetical protein QR680_014157 [Steinernema hermaphroditum]
MFSSVKNERYLPDEIWTIVLGWMDVRDDILNCAAVCRQWNETINRIYIRHKMKCVIANGIKPFVYPQLCIKYCGRVHPFEAEFLPDRPIHTLEIYGGLDLETFETLKDMMNSQSLSTLKRLNICNSWSGLGDRFIPARYLLSHPLIIESLEYLQVDNHDYDELVLEFLRKAKKLKEFSSDEGLASTLIIDFLVNNLHKLVIDWVYFGAVDGSVISSCHKFAEALKRSPRKFFMAAAQPSDYRDWMTSFEKVAQLPSKSDHWPVAHVAVQKTDGQLWVFAVHPFYDMDNFIEVAKPEDSPYFVKYFVERFMEEDIRQNRDLRSATFSLKTTNYEYVNEGIIFTIEIDHENCPLFENVEYSAVERRVNERLLEEFGQPISIRIFDPSRLSEEDRDIFGMFQTQHIGRRREQYKMGAIWRIERVYDRCADVEKELRRYGAHNCERMNCYSRTYHRSLWEKFRKGCAVRIVSAFQLAKQRLRHKIAKHEDYEDM